MGLQQLRLVLLCCLLSALLEQRPANAAKILAVYAFPGRSHYMMHKAVIRELIENGHQVTMITSLSLSALELGSNYTEVLIEPVYDFLHDASLENGENYLFDMNRRTNYDFIKVLELIGLKTTEHALRQPKVQELINANHTEGVFDLLLAEQFYQDAFLALAYKYNIPIVTSCAADFQIFMSQMMGLMSPWSFVPQAVMPFNDHMSFLERLINTYVSLTTDLFRLHSYFPKMDVLTERYFGNSLDKVPKVRQMVTEVSLMLINSHAPLTTSRPNVANMVPVGGIQIYPAKPLPQDMQSFLDEATDGAIYFSLGSYVESKDMPKHMLRIFVNVLGSLKQRVLWKFEDESIGQLKDNMMVRKWMPQVDILAHPNVKVFITHGGLMSVQEAVQFSVPILGMPFYGDQFHMMRLAVDGGYGINLHFQSITEQILRHSLQQLIQNASYKDNMQRVSRIFRDRPMEPRKTAIYWIEYVIRHKGARHMRSAGLDLNWYQFYLLDVIAFVAGIALTVLLAIFLAFRLLRGSNKQHKKAKTH